MVTLLLPLTLSTPPHPLHASPDMPNVAARMVRAVNAAALAEQLINELLPTLISLMGPDAAGRALVRSRYVGSKMVVERGPVAADMACARSVSLCALTTEEGWVLLGWAVWMESWPYPSKEKLFV